MKEKLNKIRKYQPCNRKKNSVLFSGLILLLGVLLGLISKWLDNLALDNTVWWHRAVERLDLGNVFSSLPIWLLFALVIAVYSTNPLKAAINDFLFFGGMCASYHLYTIFFSGFDPSAYMMIWYAIALFSPILAVLCWYGKGESTISITIDILIFAVMICQCFSIGWIYFGLTGMVNLIIFFASIAVLYKSPRQTIVSVLAGIAVSFVLSPFLSLGK